MKAIKTLGDLRELIKWLDGLSDKTNIDFANNFQQFSVEENYNYNVYTNTITLPTKLEGSILKGTHRVLGGKE